VAIDLEAGKKRSKYNQVSLFLYGLKTGAPTLSENPRSKLHR